jgi:general secretion pathway protein F
MPLFSYEAADSSGRKLRATVEAADESSLKADLKEKNLVPLVIKSAQERKIPTFQRVTQKDLMTFTQELGSLIEAGLPIDRAMFVLSEHTEKEALKVIIRELYIDLQRGHSLSRAMSRHKIFPKVYVNMISAGEAGGIMEIVIRRLSAFLETTVAFKEEVTSALLYPLMLTGVIGLAVAFMMFFVVPKFSSVFQDMGQALPLPTLMLLGISQWIISYWWALAAGLAALVITLKAYSRTSEGHNFIDGLKLKVPGVRGIHVKMIIARFSRTLGTLLQSGVPILDAIKVSREVVGNDVVSDRLKIMEDGVRKGRGVATPLRESGVFPSILGQMVATGEEAGRLEETFLTVADRFEGESKRHITRVVSLLAPVMILLMGLIVGFIVISILLAIFSINEIPI